MEEFDDLDSNVSDRRSRLPSVPVEAGAPSATPDVYEERQAAGASLPATRDFSTALPALAIGALVGFLAGFWIFQDRD